MLIAGLQMTLDEAVNDDDAEATAEATRALNAATDGIDEFNNINRPGGPAFAGQIREQDFENRAQFESAEALSRSHVEEQTAKIVAGTINAAGLIVAESQRVETLRRDAETAAEIARNAANMPQFDEPQEVRIVD